MCVLPRPPHLETPTSYMWNAARGMTSVALYIHWPYCAKICPYCDFNRYLLPSPSPSPSSSTSANHAAPAFDLTGLDLVRMESAYLTELREFLRMKEEVLGSRPTITSVTPFFICFFTFTEIDILWRWDSLSRAPVTLCVSY